MCDVIGIFGGTFSPPHAGHLHAANIFYEAIKPDRLLIIPSYTPPHKEVDDLASGEDRLAMCRLAFSSIPSVEVSDIEIKRQGKSYTADTLMALKKSFGDCKLAFLLGTDMMLTLDTWYRPDIIFSLCDLYCIRREDDEALGKKIEEKNREYLAKFGKQVTLISATPLEVCSSEIREALAKGNTTPHLHPSVMAYIQNRGLYR